ncbi:hypothetical protein AAG906_004483 [Vitis piasezkii]
MLPCCEINLGCSERSCPFYNVHFVERQGFRGIVTGPGALIALRLDFGTLNLQTLMVNILGSGMEEDCSYGIV